MKAIQDNTIEVQPHDLEAPDFRSRQKILQDGDAESHLSILSGYLGILPSVIKILPFSSKGSNDLEQFISRVKDTLDVILLRNILLSKSPNSDVRMLSSINPADSGFPTYLRDFRYLTQDKAQALHHLETLPSVEEIVSNAENLCFRLAMPTQSIRAMISRDYFSKLASLDLPQELRQNPEVDLGQKGSMTMFLTTVERIDSHTDTPRFYTIIYKIPTSLTKSMMWKESIHHALAQAIKEGTSTIVDLELPYLARKIEDIDGIQLQLLERFDIGPFYSRYTTNSDIINQVLKVGNERDGILQFRKRFVQRLGERELPTLWERIQGWWSGDQYHGFFTSTLETPQYSLMPHRLVQAVHQRDLSFGQTSTMYAITDRGELSG